MSSGLFSDISCRTTCGQDDLPTSCSFLYFQENMLGCVHMYTFLIFSKLNVFRTTHLDCVHCPVVKGKGKGNPVTGPGVPIGRVEV
jgi:hypothetical protein